MRTLAQRRKAIVALLGALISWAVATFPDNAQVQLYGGLVASLLAAAGVHQVTNAPGEDPDTPPPAQPAEPGPDGLLPVNP